MKKTEENSKVKVVVNIPEGKQKVKVQDELAASIEMVSVVNR